MTDDFIVDLKGYILMEHRFPREAWCDPDDVQAALDEIEQLRGRVNLLAGYLTGALNVIDRFVGWDTSEARAALGEASDDAAT
jgi:hypothetical protein